MLSPEDKDRLRTIKGIRATNNDHWMELLEIALEVAPERTKKVLNKIRNNDEAISMLTRELSNHDHQQAQDRSEPATVPYSRSGR